MRFTVPGPPQTWKRTNTFKGRRITDKAMKAYQNRIRGYASVSGVRRMDGPLSIRVDVYLARMAGDWDNYGKNVCDALNGIAYDDDRQIVDGRVVKHRDPANPRLEVTIEAVESAR
jgi:Holliday junction resolvase RusA-like endonuclease